MSTFVLEHLVISKFGGSALGIDGSKIPIIVNSIKELKKV